MNAKLLSLTLAAASTLSAGAADVKVTAFPPTRPESPQLQAKPMNAPLNQERKKGLKVFGTSYIDYNRSRSFVNYYENQFLLDRLSTVATAEEVQQSGIPDLYQVNAGAYNHDDGYYYAYKVKYYTIGITYSYQWLRVNPVDGTWEEVAKLDNHMHDRTYLYDLAYSPYDGEMWGLVQNSDGQVKSRVGIVNLANSEVTDLIQLPEYYFGISFDYEGNAFGIRWDYDPNDPTGAVIGTRLDKFDKNFKVVSSLPVTVDGNPWKSYYQHGLDFDYTTGDLIWGATNNQGDQKMIRINPETAETVNLGGVGWNEVMLGLHVPFREAEDRQAPAIVKDLAFIINAQGDNAVTISWTNPSTQWNRQELTNLSSVKVYRDNMDGEPLTTLDATGKEGEKMEYEDKTASAGIHTYYVVACNAAGDGVSDSIEAFVGKDTPGPVNNITVETFDNGKSVKLKWDVPTIGDSEGWFDSSSLTYKVVRMPDNHVVTESTKLRILNDKNIEEAQFYTYVITPINNEGEGTPATSEGILAGQSIKIPFASKMDNQNEAARFSSFDHVGSTNLFSFNANNSKPGGLYSPTYYTSNSNNATIATPPLSVTEGKTYRVKWNFTICRHGSAMGEVEHHLAIIGGTELRRSSMTVHEDFPKFISTKSIDDLEVTSYFVAPVTGDYYIGFNILSEIANWQSLQPWVYMTGFEIIEVKDNDLQALSLDTPRYVSSTHYNDFRVSVHNVGLNEQSNYKVQVGVSRLDGAFIPFAETTDVPAVKSRETAEVVVSGALPTGQGVQDLVGRVVLEGDQDPDNNDTDFNEVNFFEGEAYNYRADEEYSRWIVSTLPISVDDEYSASQTYYTTEMLGLDQDMNTISGLAWVYNSDIDINLEELKIWLSATDKDLFARKSFDRNDNRLVYDGKLSLPAGKSEWMRVSLDNLFEIGKDQNLLVTISARESANTGTRQFPLQFHIWNDGNANFNASDGLSHSFCYSGAQPFDFSQDGYIYEQLPVLYVAANGRTYSSVECLGAAPADMLSVKIAGRTARVSGGASTIEVLDFNGRRVFAANVEGASSVTLPVAAGLYIVKVSDKEGNAAYVKASVR